MKVVMVYKKASEMTGQAEDWKEEFARRTGREIVVLDPETREGESFCGACGIVEYPAIVVQEESMGKVSQVWQGHKLPLFDDVLAYL